MPAPNREQRLDSWKEIADYLGKDVRTAIRWEKERGLPVHRLPGGKRQPVFAFAAEIDAWASEHKGESGDGVPQAALPRVDSGNVGEPAPSVSNASYVGLWVGAGFGALALLILLVVFFRARATEPRAAPAANSFGQDLQLNAGPRSLRFRRSPIESGVRPYLFVAADLNGDGNMDLVFSSAPAGVVGILLGNGDGTFQPVRLIEGCPYSFTPVVADFNRDGHPDIAVTCFAGNFVLILWGRGDGTFPERTQIPLPGGPRCLAVGDLNGDGWPDLAVGSYGAESAVYAILNRAGQFFPVRLSPFEAATAVTIADLNGDGRKEIVAGVRDHGHFAVAVLQVMQDGSAQAPRMLKGSDSLQTFVQQLEMADLGHKGTLDLIASMEGGDVWIRRGRGRGEFSGSQVLFESDPTLAGALFVLADLDLDGNPDLLVTDFFDHALVLFTGSADGSFKRGGLLVVGKRPFSPVIADFNNDHVPDIVVNDYFEGPSLLTATWKKEVNF